MNHEPYETLAATYAVGALDGQDRVDFERHLAAGCDVCEATLRESAEALAALARSRPPMIPPPAVKEALLGRIATAPARREASRPRPWVWVIGTIAAVIAGAAFTGTFVATRYEAQLGVMARETAELRARILREDASLREQLAVYRNAADLLRDPQAQVVTLRGLGPSLEATGRVIWHPVNGGYVFVSNLPSAPPGKAYEMWTIADAAPQPAGLFQVDASGRAAHRIPAAPGGKPVKVFAVTLEVEAGVQQPEGPMVLASAK